MGIARSNLLCCVRTRRRAQAQQHHDGGSEDEANKAFLGATCACCAVRFSHSANARQLKLPTPRRWMRGMNRVFARSPPCGLTAVAADARVVEPRLKTVAAVPAVHVEEEEVDRACDHGFSREQVAAATIQACFRGHLARRAFRALRGLVKMQAFSRGSYVRKQADLAIRCMKVLVRLQVRVRARQLFDMSKSKDQ